MSKRKLSERKFLKEKKKVMRLFQQREKTLQLRQKLQLTPIAKAVKHEMRNWK